MKALAEKFKYVNQWSLMFWAFIGLQFIIMAIRGTDFWNTVWGCVILWGFFIVGYNSLDRELEIKLDKAKEAIQGKNNVA